MSGRGFPAFGTALLRSVLSAGYWCAVLVILYATIAGDRVAEAEQSLAGKAAPWLVIVAGVLLHAVLVRIWERRR